MRVGNAARVLAIAVLVALVGVGPVPGALDDVPQLQTIVESIRPGGSCVTPTGSNDSGISEVYRLPAGGLTYRINLGSLPSGLSAAAVARAIDGAAAAWVTAGASPLTNGGTTTRKAGGKADGINTISFGGAPGGSIAVAYMWVRSGVVVEADMSLAKGFNWTSNEGASGDCSGASGNMDVQDIATHELGHWVGAQHTPTAAEYNHRTMYPYASYQELYKRSLSAGDIASIP